MTEEAYPARQSVNAADVKVHLREAFALVMPPSTAVPADADKLTQHGMDSLMATHLSSILAERFDLNLSPAIAFEYPTLESLAARIVELTQRRHVA